MCGRKEAAEGVDGKRVSVSNRKNVEWKEGVRGSVVSLHSLERVGVSRMSVGRMHHITLLHSVHSSLKLFVENFKTKTHRDSGYSHTSLISGLGESSTMYIFDYMYKTIHLIEASDVNRTRKMTHCSLDLHFG